MASRFRFDLPSMPLRGEVSFTIWPSHLLYATIRPARHNAQPQLFSLAACAPDRFPPSAIISALLAHGSPGRRSRRS